MKYIKTFEEIETIDSVNHSDPGLLGKGQEPDGALFKAGDYVKFFNATYPFKLEHYYYHPLAKKYQCFVTQDDFSRQWIYEDELRLATPEEVEEYELKKASHKYNI